MVQELIRKGNLAIRLMRADVSDYAYMARWLTDPRLLEFYEGRDNPLSLEQIKEKYSPRVLGLENVTPCLLTLDDVPIGYLQFYPITEETKHEYGLETASAIDDVYGIDQFIGEVGLWNKGFGTSAVVLLLQYLFQTRGARKVILDPHTGNARAIRCYEKCGFRKVKILPANELHEGEYRDCWLMEVDSGWLFPDFS